MQRKQSDSTKASSRLGVRLGLLVIGLLCLLSLSFARFFVLQVVQGDYWKQLADKQHVFKVRQPFFRGHLWLDDEICGQKYALSYDLAYYHLFADCSQLSPLQKDSIANFLKGKFKLSEPQYNHLCRQLKMSSRSRRLISKISLQTKKEVERWWRQFAKEQKLQRNSLFFIQDGLRSHPSPQMLAALAHTTQLLKDEQTQQAQPTGGLELFLDKRLQGKLGWRYLKRTLKNPLSSAERFIPPVHGASVTLTVNPRLQAVAERVLEQAIKRFQAQSAWAIVMDPNSGKVLCLAQAPSFDLDQYSKYFSDPELSFRAKVWGVSNAYEPGSVLKPINLAIALKANETLLAEQKKSLFDPQLFVDVRPSKLPGRKIPLRDVSPANFLNMDLALQRSSNVYMAKLMHQLCDTLGSFAYQRALLEFGFGQASGIELPSETLGVVPQPGRINAWGALEWSSPTPSSLAMGHNILVNSLQLLRAYAVLANGGWLVKPTLIERIELPVASGYETLYMSERDVRYRSRKVLTHASCQRVLEAMSYTLKPRGSAFRGDFAGYSIAAKTGTANKIFQGHYDSDHTLSTFIGILPIHAKNRLVILVSIDEPKRFFIPGQGYNHRAGFCASPIFHLIAQEAVGILGISPDYPRSFLPHDPRFESSNSYWSEQNRALQEMYRKWNSHESPPLEKMQQ